MLTSVKVSAESFQARLFSTVLVAQVEGETLYKMSLPFLLHTQGSVVKEGLGRGRKAGLHGPLRVPGPQMENHYPRERARNICGGDELGKMFGSGRVLVGVGRAHGCCA